MHQYIDLLILAKKATHAATDLSGGGSDGKSYSLSWAIVGIGLIVGLLVTLSPTKRTTDIKKSKHD